MALRRFPVMLRAMSRRGFHSGAADLTLPKQLGSLNAINPKLRAMEYAVRGELVIKAEEYQQDLATGRKQHPFDEVVLCNIGNPQALKQQPITFSRQVLSLCLNPGLLDAPEAEALFPSDVRDRARKFLKAAPSIGAYTHSKGLPVVRESIARFIEARDGYPSDPERVFVTDGASPAVQTVLRTLIRSPQDGILAPIPQYPLYSAAIAAEGGALCGYFLDEDNDWGLSMEELDRAYRRALHEGVTPRAVAIINPGNPTGACLAEEEIRNVIAFARKNRLVVLADEVYQTNVYSPEERPFRSFKRVLKSMGDEYAHTELFSFHSVSKGVTGECGLRGGYMEVEGLEQPILDQLYKNVSVNLCSNTVGQLSVEMMVNPPKPGEPSYDLYKRETQATYDSLRRRALVLVDALNAMEGVSCNPAEGAMYAFPKITLPPKVVAAAEAAGKKPDVFYCLELLKGTGVCVVPGSGFGQKEGTWHFRTTFLPQEDKISGVVERMGQWHKEFLAKYK